ncbi:hypothetical protein FAX13_09280 [Ligilactobacillus animalis]|nr:hypothetical protein FAX13_09280 [Ligilactobacillus animalis]
MKLNKIVETIRNAESVEVVLIVAKKHYKYIPYECRATVFNKVIFKERYGGSISLKLVSDLSLLFMSYPYKKFTWPRKKRITREEICIFIILAKKIQTLYNKQQVEQVSTNSSEDVGITFLNYHFTYPAISCGEYFKFFELFDCISKEVYNFSIYRNAIGILELTSEMPINLWITKEKLEKKFNKELNIKDIDKLFYDVREINKNDWYPTDITKKFKGKIGIKFNNRYFVPQSYFIMVNILRYLTERAEANNRKGKILENYTKNLFENFFKNDGIVKGPLYDEKGNEQDIIIRYKDTVISVECKAQDFKEVFRDRNKAKKRLHRRFNSVLLKGAKQCDRVKENFKKNDTVKYYDSGNCEHRKLVFDIKNSRDKIKVLKIVVTMDEYLDLAESPYNFINDNYTDTWFVSLMTLKKILWKSNPEEFIRYVIYRSSEHKAITSLASNELDQFGYFISDNYNLYPNNYSLFEIYLNSSFSRVFDEYDREYTKEEISRLKKLIKK